MPGEVIYGSRRMRPRWPNVSTHLASREGDENGQKSSRQLSEHLEAEEMVRRTGPGFDRSRPRVYVDLLHTDGKEHEDGRRRILLDLVGTREDLATHNIVLSDGLSLLLYSDDADAGGNRDDLLVEGIVEFDQSLEKWVAVIDWAAVRHESELRGRPTTPS